MNPIGFDFPFDLEGGAYSEAYVLGAIMRWGAGRAECEPLTSRDFFYPEHQWIWSAICELDDEGTPPEIDAVAERLRSAGNLERAGGLPRLLALETAGTSTATLHVHAAELRSRTLKRDVEAMAERLQREADTTGVTGAELVEDAETELIALQRQQENRTEISALTLARTAMQEFQTRYENRGKPTGVSTGLTELDAVLFGLQPSDLVVLAARPSMGKTALALSIIENACVRAHVPTAFFSVEMGKEAIRDRLYSQIGRIPGDVVRTGRFSEADWARLARATNEITAAPLTLFDVPTLTLQEMRGAARKLAARNRCGLIVVDYLQKMSTEHAESRERGIAELSQGLKALAKELHVPVLALAQLNRQVETRAEKKPTMADLRESGAIEQDADVILFLYRDEVYNPESAERGQAQIIIGKHRNGETGVVKTRWVAEHTRFCDL